MLDVLVKYWPAQIALDVQRRTGARLSAQARQARKEARKADAIRRGISILERRAIRHSLSSLAQTVIEAIRDDRGMKGLWRRDPDVKTIRGYLASDPAILGRVDNK